MAIDDPSVERGNGTGAETANKVILEGFDNPLHNIDSMFVSGDELPSVELIVQHIKLWLKASCSRYVKIDSNVFNFVFFSVCHWSNQDCIGGVVICNEYILHTI